LLSLSWRPFDKLRVSGNDTRGCHSGAGQNPEKHQQAVIFIYWQEGIRYGFCRYHKLLSFILSPWLRSSALSLKRQGVTSKKAQLPQLTSFTEDIESSEKNLNGKPVNNRAASPFVLARSPNPDGSRVKHGMTEEEQE